MKISVNDQEIFTLSQTKMNVIKNDIHEDQFDQDMKRRLQYILEHKYEQCFKRLKQDWEPQLKADGVEFIPTNEEAFAQLVFSHPNYKSRKQRDVIQQIV